MMKRKPVITVKAGVNSHPEKPVHVLLNHTEIASRQSGILIICTKTVRLGK
jgi:hypothetical protein